VLHAAWRIGTRAIANRWMAAITAAAFIAIFVFGTPFPAVVAAAALAGHFGARRWPDRFALGGAHGTARKDPGAALIDDHTPRAAHTLFDRGRLATVPATGAVLWLGTMGTRVALHGPDGTLTRMAWFFTKAALLTFGGACAVLPHVYPGAVEHYQWLTAAQMIDGLALGESTPGPLIIVVAFVGFLGGWFAQVSGPEAPFPGAACAVAGRLRRQVRRCRCADHGGCDRGAVPVPRGRTAAAGRLCDGRTGLEPAATGPGQLTLLQVRTPDPGYVRTGRAPGRCAPRP